MNAREMELEVHDDIGPATELRRPTSPALWMVLIYIALFLLRPWEVLLPFLQSIRFERVYGILMLGVVLLTGRRLRWTRQSLSVIGLFLAAALSSFRAWQTDLAWPQLYQYATVVATYFLMQISCRRWSDLACLVCAYVGAMHLYLSKSLWEYFLHNRHVYAQGVNRLMGIEVTYGEPNAVAMSAVLALPCWLFLWRCRRELMWPYGRGTRRVFDLLLISFPPICFISVGLTNSRAGMLGLAAFVVGALWFRVQRRKLFHFAFFAAGLVVVIFLIAPQTQRDRLRTLWNPHVGPANARESAGGRWQGFLASLDMVRAKPMTGVGLGNFVAYRVSYLDGVGLLAHNLPGQLLGEMGLVGAVAFSWFGWLLWRGAKRLQLLAQDDVALRHYVQLAVMIQLTILLLLLFGLSLHNALRYNWMWLASFVTLALECCGDDWEQLVEESEADSVSTLLPAARITAPPLLSGSHTNAGLPLVALAHWPRSPQ